MTPTLSIIIPCYNCEQTLREAVESCYQQGFEADEFEIVMVDDGSKDGTRLLMETLAREHSEIKLYFHPENRGGGATRNTGIKEACGELIYCLDSDNVFAKNSLRPMIEFLKEKKLDGVAFYERRFFLGNNLRKFKSQCNKVLERNIKLTDIFKEKEPLLDNFIYKKSAYEKTTGYPEHHGFDTQCYEIRYLSAGNTVQICPGSVFYHRTGMNEQSYYERVYTSGMFSVNWMLIYEEIFYLFKPEIQKKLVDSSIFEANSDKLTNVNSFIKNESQAGTGVLVSDYEKYLNKNGAEQWKNDFKSLIADMPLPHALIELHNHKYDIANSLLAKYLEKESSVTPYIAFLQLRIMHGLANVPYQKQVSSTLALTTSLKLKSNVNRGGALGAFIRRNKTLYSIIRFWRQLLQ